MMKTPSFSTLALNLALCLGLATVGAGSAMSQTLADTAPSVQAGSTTLQLSGAGVRHQAGSGAGLYRAALYRDSRTATAGAQQLRVVMLQAMDAREMGDLLARGLIANASEAELAALVPVLFHLGEIFGEQQRLAVGDTFQISWQPGVGTLITINGRPQGEAFVQPEVFSVMLRLWLGDQPADAQLKAALLGGKA